MMGFKKNEAIAIFVILAVLAFVVRLNLNDSFRKSRDVARKGDLRALSDAFEKYQIDFSSFPQAENGEIVACFVPSDEGAEYVACSWGNGSVSGVLDGARKTYLQDIPQDPLAHEGVSYVYFSNGRRYQVYASLESDKEPEYNPQVVSRNISCGTRICNYGLSFQDTPLDRTIEEYENELRIKNAK
ncbi:hypothetical protein C4564_00365 [Candidatus Microgenomates bacterium]|nr:MAG: hypothetical protein C4564_00365 [Candidatus Microgenomates bacterium]